MYSYLFRIVLWKVMIFDLQTLNEKKQKTDPKRNDIWNDFFIKNSINLYLL